MLNVIMYNNNNDSKFFFIIFYVDEFYFNFFSGAWHFQFNLKNRNKRNKGLKRKSKKFFVFLISLGKIYSQYIFFVSCCFGWRSHKFENSRNWKTIFNLANASWKSWKFSVQGDYVLTNFKSPMSENFMQRK